MVKPDLEMVNADYGRVYFNGKVYDLNRQQSQWTISLRHRLLYVGESAEEACAWLVITPA